MASNLELLVEADRRGLLPPDKQEMLKEARSRGLVPTAESPAEPDATALSFAGSVGGGFNRRLADIVDAPATLARTVTAPAARAVASLFREPPTEPVPPPSNVVSEYLRSPGAAPKPRNSAERIGSTIGEVTAETLPLMGLGFAAAPLLRGTQAARAIPAASTREAVGRVIGEGMARAPVNAFVGETASTLGAGAAIGGAKEVAPGNVLAESGAALAGGFAPAAIGLTLGRAPSVLALRVARATLLPFTKGGAEIRAARRVGGLVADPEAAARRLNDPTLADLTPAQRIGEPRMMALERAVLDSDPKLEAEFAERTRQNVEALRGAMTDIGGTASVADAQAAARARRGDLIGTIETRLQRRLTDAEKERLDTITKASESRDYLAGLIDTRTRQAVDIAAQRIARLHPEMRDSEAALIVRQEVDRAHRASSTQRKDFWDEVPKEVQLPPSKGALTYRALIGKLTPEEAAANPEMAKLALPRSQLDVIPAKARQFLDPESNSKFKEIESVHEIWGLRSDLLEEARRLRAAGNHNAARVADTLGDSLLDDLGARAGEITGEAGQRLRIALDFSRLHAERFQQGPVGNILGYERTGEKAVDPLLTLESVVGRGGLKGHVGARALRAAAPSQEAEEGIRQYLLTRFREAAVRGDKVNPEAARGWVEKNTDLLDAFPDLREGMLSSATAKELAERTAREGAEELKGVARSTDTTIREAETLARREASRAERVAAARKSRVQKATEKFIGADIDDALDPLFTTGGPAAAAGLRSLVSKDRSGRALQGLKAGVVDNLIRRSEKDGAPSGASLQAILGHGRTRRALGNIMSEDELLRLDRIAREFAKINASQGRLPDIGGVITDMPSTILDYAARVLAARHGAALGKGTSGASLLTANLASQRSKQMLTSLTRDRAHELLTEAVRDPYLMQTLLMRVNTPAAAKIAGRRLNAWLLGEPGRAYSNIVGEDETE